MEGSDCLAVCLIASFSSALVRRDSEGVCVLDVIGAQPFPDGGTGWLYGGGGPVGYDEYVGLAVVVGGPTFRSWFSTSR